MNRRGFTLIELVLSLTLSGILGVAIVKILLTTSRFYQQDNAIRSARTLARSPLGLLESDLLGVEPSGGLLAADSLSLTVRSAYATGALCGISGNVATVSLLPGDSLLIEAAGYSGYAWRQAGSWTYVAATTRPGAGSAAVCSAAGISTLAGGRVVTLTPAPPSAAAPATPITLYQQLTYRFAPSSRLPGRQALWRDMAATASSEEIAAPFATSARFRYFTGASDSSRPAAAAPLSATRGIELVLDGASERPPHNRGTLETSGITTGIFFRRAAQ